MPRFFVSLLLLWIVASGLLYAQSDESLKVNVTTVNGDKINGYLKFKSLPSQFTIFYTTQDSIILYSDLVQSISFTKQPENGNKTDPHKPGIKYFNNTMVGVLSGKSTDDAQPVASLTVETINGILIYRYLTIGIGIAYDQYNTTAALPFFISIRGDILTQPFTPFYFIDAGYGGAWDTRENDLEILDVEGGAMLHAGIGFKMYSDNRVNVMIALGYKYQKTVYHTVEWSGGVRVTDRTYKRLSFSLGIGF